MTLLLPNDIANDTPANAVPVEQNYNVIEEYINRECVVRDGAVAMTGQLLLVGDPTQPLAAAAKQYVDAILPVGVILPFGGLAAPAGKWAACNGAILQQSEYPKLFSVLGNRYSGTVAAGQFRLPNLQGRIPIGMNPTDTDFATTGKAGGTWAPGLKAHTHEHPHTHTINHDHAQVNTGAAGQHNHGGYYSPHANPGSGGFYFLRRPGDSGTTVDTAVQTEANHTHPVNLPSFTGTSGAVSEATTGSAGTDTKVMPPYVVLFYIIRVD